MITQRDFQRALALGNESRGDLCTDDWGHLNTGRLGGLVSENRKSTARIFS